MTLYPKEQSPCIGCPREHEDKNKCATDCEKRVAYLSVAENWQALPRYGEKPAKSVVVPLRPIETWEPPAEKRKEEPMTKELDNRVAKLESKHTEMEKKIAEQMRTIKRVDDALKEMGLEFNKTANTLKKKVSALEKSMREHRHLMGGEAVVITKL
jgi:uncharacterized coiled-coil protein SlyX